MPAPWQRAEVARVLQTRIFAVDRHRLVSPRPGGETHDFYIVECGDWCNIVPLTPDDQVVMVRQHRYGTGEETLELPGGMVDPTDRDPGEAARRELLEETGYRAGVVEPIGVIATNPALLTNRCHSFVARGVELVGAPRQEGGEDIEVVTVPLVSIPERIRGGEISHALVVVAFAYLFGLRA